MIPYTVATYAERPDLVQQAEAMAPETWPEYMLNDAVSNRLWGRLKLDMLEFQFMILGEGDEILSVSNSLSMDWDGQPASLPPEGWDRAFERGFDELDRGQPPNTLCALSITIHPRNQVKGISQIAVTTMRDIARRHGFGDLIAPVRPNWKRDFKTLLVWQKAHQLTLAVYPAT